MRQLLSLERFAQEHQRLADVQAHQFPAVWFIGMFFEGVWNLSFCQDGVECLQTLTQADALVVTVGGSLIEVDP